MKLLLEAQRKRLIANHNANQERFNSESEKEHDFFPVVKLFTPWANCTWLLSELDPATNIAFGLCDLGMGSPELGSVGFDEILSVQGPFGLRVERDMHWQAKKTLSQYAKLASKAGHIVD